jgi:hypothetical protein
MRARNMLGPCVGLAVVIVLAGCAAFQSITPAHRAQGYELDAKAARLACKAYRFDRAAGLVPDVPAMSELCE